MKVSLQKKSLLFVLFLIQSLFLPSIASAYSFEKVTDRVWVMHGPLELPNPENKGFMNNPAVIDTSAGLVIVDPGSSLQVGEMVLSELAKISPEISKKKVIAIFNTHVHGDHWLANQAIVAAHPLARIYGHNQMIKEVNSGEGEKWVELMSSLTNGATKGTKVVPPRYSVQNQDMVTVGDDHFRIHHYGKAHTNTDIMIEAVELKTVFLGDNILAGRVANMSDGTFVGNMKAADKILETKATTWVPGHGQTVKDDVVKNFRKYLSSVYDAAKKAFDNDLDSSDVIKTTKKTTAEFKDWASYDDLLGKHGAQAYAEVEAANF